MPVRGWTSLIAGVIACGGCRTEGQSTPPTSRATTSSPDPSPDPSTREGGPAPGEAALRPDDGGPPLTPEEIRLVVRAKLGAVRACFDAGLAAAGSLEHGGEGPQRRGRVLLRFTIGADGKATDLRVLEDELGVPAVTSCILAELPRWQFPRPRGGASVTVAYPFAFSSEQALRAAGLPRVEGTLKPEAVGAVFEARRAELDACVPDDTHGLVGVALSIDDRGSVTRISAYEDTLPGDAGACVLRVVSSWTFPPAARGDEARVNHDLRW